MEHLTLESTVLLSGPFCFMVTVSTSCSDEAQEHPYRIDNSSVKRTRSGNYPGWSSHLYKSSPSHPALGDITGRLMSNPDGHDVVHFCSIPYATIPGRFKASVLLGGLPDRFDDRPRGKFTQFGAACPQLNNPVGPAAYGGTLPDNQDIRFDEFTCLALSMSVPKAALEGKSPKALPVMVYVHGGGLAEGAAHVNGLHEMKIVAFGIQENRPVIMVNIGYRLSWLGFLICRDDLLEEAQQSSGSNARSPASAATPPT
jgi:carboxylesterase type B